VPPPATPVDGDGDWQRVERSLGLGLPADYKDLLPWATTTSGTDLFWLTEGRPDNWPTAVWNVREGGHRYDRGAVDLLHGYLSGQVHIKLLGPPRAPCADRRPPQRPGCVRPADGPFQGRRP
jgi:hypothetical protein